MAKPIRAAFGQIDLPINTAKPRLMHIDMNSCFASIEQQANPLLRDRPIVVSPYTSPRGIIVAPSVEAKALGIKLGMRNQEAKEICPNLVILPPDPDKYRDAHRRFKEILLSYTDQVYPRSIDEAIVDFRGTLDSRKLLDIGAEIKKRIYEEIGVAIRVSVGIGPNRWLAKLAAGLTKPDGLEQIDEHNLEDVYSRVELTDLPGINVRYEARLKANGIHTPLELMNTPMITLKKRVFGSVNGYYWHLRMRGWEIDDIEWQRKSIGHSYALKKKTEDTESLERILIKLCEKAGRRLRRNDLFSQGISLSLGFRHRWWRKNQKTSNRLYTTNSIFEQAKNLLAQRPEGLVINMSVTLYSFQPLKPIQFSLFNSSIQEEEALSKSLDNINDKYGEFVVSPALMMDMKEIVDRIAFGGIRDMDKL